MSVFIYDSDNECFELFLSTEEETERDNRIWRECSRLDEEAKRYN